VVYLLSDLTAHAPDDVGRFAADCAARDASARVVHLASPDDFELLGYGWDVRRRTMYDRAEVTPEDLAAFAAAESAEAAARVRKADSRFASVSSGWTWAEISAVVAAAGLFD
jgi:hypothetical protein